MRQHNALVLAIKLYKRIGYAFKVDGATLLDHESQEEPRHLRHLGAEKVVQNGHLLALAYKRIGKDGVKHVVLSADAIHLAHIAVHLVQHAGVIGHQKQRLGIIDIYSVVFHLLSRISVKLGVLQLARDEVRGLLAVRKLRFDKLLGNFNAEVGNLVLQVVHRLEFLVVDVLAGILHNAVGLSRGTLAGLLYDLLAGHTCVAQHLVALQLGLLQQVLVVSLQLGHLRLGLLGHIQSVVYSLLALIQSLENHRPAPLHKDECQYSKGNDHPHYHTKSGTN